MRMYCILGTAAAFVAFTGAAQATVNVSVDLTHQRMNVTSSSGSYSWPISSARSGFSTPGGSYAPTHLERMHYSKLYHNSPMPYSIFFRGGYAIHGTYSTGQLGQPASHGCIRLAPGNAATLYHMVQSEGARISISGSPPASRPFANEYAHARHRGGRYAYARGYGGDNYYASQNGDGYMQPAQPNAFDIFGTGGAGF